MQQQQQQQQKKIKGKKSICDETKWKKLKFETILFFFTIKFSIQVAWNQKEKLLLRQRIKEVRREFRL